MKKTIIKSSLFAIICLLAVSSKSFAQAPEKQQDKPTTDIPKGCKEVTTIDRDVIGIPGAAQHTKEVITREIICPKPNNKKK